MDEAQMTRADGHVRRMRKELEALEALLALSPSSDLIGELKGWIDAHQSTRPGQPGAHLDLTYSTHAGTWDLAVWPGGGRQHPKLQEVGVGSGWLLEVKGTELWRVCAEMLSYLREVTEPSDG